MDSSGIRILLVDDHEIFLAGLRLLLKNEPDLNVIGEARNKAEAFQAVRNLPDVILLDLDLGAEMATDFLPDLVMFWRRLLVRVTSRPAMKQKC